jgi:hypothetical protein
MAQVLCIVSGQGREPASAMQAKSEQVLAAGGFQVNRMVRILPVFQDFGCVLFPLFSGYIAPDFAMNGSFLHR